MRSLLVFLLSTLFLISWSRMPRTTRSGWDNLIVLLTSHKLRICTALWTVTIASSSVFSMNRSTVFGEVYTSVSNTRCSRGLSHTACSFTDEMGVWLIKAFHSGCFRGLKGEDWSGHLLQLGGGGDRSGGLRPATPRTSWVWRFTWLNTIYRVWVPSGAVYVHSTTEHSKGVGGGITVFCLVHVFRDIIDKFTDFY
eukprot:GFUD01041337.1.p1 GENE.GFUD01041337.1~~GFUD01041337.1.p1  ORF type:complete len:196 (+),score=9.43 GFUD01041337.1:199-786(+)